MCVPGFSYITVFIPDENATNDKSFQKQKNWRLISGRITATATLSGKREIRGRSTDPTLPWLIRQQRTRLRLRRKSRGCIRNGGGGDNYGHVMLFISAVRAGDTWTNKWRLCAVGKITRIQNHSYVYRVWRWKNKKINT